VKRILVTDTHVGYKKSSIKYLELMFQLFEDIGKFAEENEIKELIHLGDFFDNRRNISGLAFHYARRIGLNLRGRFDKSHFIIGNHDLYYKDRYLPTFHEMFFTMEHIDVIMEPTEVGNMLLMPWIVEESEFFNPQDYYTMYENSDAEYCLGHWEINGAKMNVSGREAEGSAWNFSSFAQFKQTFSGHFHTPGEYPSNVKYLGATHHMDFNDAGPRGWYVFDDETGELDFIPWDRAPKYIQWRAVPDNVYGGEFEGQIVKIIFDEDYGTTTNNQIITDVYNTNPLQVFTEYKFTKVVTDDKVDEDVKLAGHTEIHKSFVEKSEVPKHLSRKVLDKFVDQIYEEIDA
jgi:DNA repair exonuclease SbcCD nuclease subunit